MIYALQFALQPLEELRRRGTEQNDNALLPRKFLGRCCLFFNAVNTGGTPHYSLSVYSDIIILVVVGVLRLLGSARCRQTSRS